MSTSYSFDDMFPCEVQLVFILQAGFQNQTGVAGVYIYNIYIYIYHYIYQVGQCLNPLLFTRDPVDCVNLKMFYQSYSFAATWKSNRLILGQKNTL